MRLFYGLKPDESICRAIAQWRNTNWPQLSRPVVPDNLHMTLVFLGDVDTETSRRLIDGSRSARGFKLTLDSTGHWPQSHVLWLGPRYTPPGLLSLAGDLRELASNNGINVEKRPYQSHMTLARGVREPPETGGLVRPFEFEVSEYRLFQSVMTRRGVRYRTLECFTQPRSS